MTQPVRHRVRKGKEKGEGEKGREKEKGGKKKDKGGGCCFAGGRYSKNQGGYVTILYRMNCVTC